MALRVALASLAGAAFGASSYTSRAAQRGDMLNNMGSRSDYGSAEDLTALDIKQELEHERQNERNAGYVSKKATELTYKFRPFKLGEIINLTEETAIFRFLLPNADDKFEMEACSTLQAQRKDGAMQIEQLQRLYTPITPNGTVGYFDILVKKQPHGRMTEHLYSMQVGDSLNFRVVMHKLKYYPNVFDNVGMVGTGTGITALLQVIRASAGMKDDKTKMHLLFANPSDRRVLLKGTIDDLAKRMEGRLKVFYTVDKILGPDPWHGLVGHIDTAMLRATMPPPGKKNMILVCGSDKLMNTVCGTPYGVLKPWSSGQSMQPAAAHGAGNVTDYLGGYLGSLGYMSEHVYRF